MKKKKDFCSNCKADQRLWFCHMGSAVPLLITYIFFCDCTVGLVISSIRHGQKSKLKLVVSNGNNNGIERKNER